MNRQERIESALRPFVPAGVEKHLAKRLIDSRCQLTITRERKTKAGDYRHPWGENGHRISVNGTLNQYAFLVTFIHELAHLVTWENHRNKVKPHGVEWKRAFQQEMQPLLTEKVFPESLLSVLSKHMKNPKSATVRDSKLVMALREFDEENGTVLLDEISTDSEFVFNGRTFVKEEKLRSRFRCVEKGTEKVYLISGIAEVKSC